MQRRAATNKKTTNLKSIAIVVSVMFVVVILIGFVAYHFMSANAAKSTENNTFNYSCSAGQESLSCYQKKYQTITQQQGVSAAFTKLKAAYSSSQTVQAYCHQLAHVIGRTEADKVNNVDIAYSQGDNFCWSGYYHGVMESIVTKIGAKNLDAKIPTICASIKKSKPYSFYHYNCVHGIGHGIMDVTDSKLYVSLSTCDLLTDDWERQSCYGGVFMENEMDEVNPDHHTAFFKASDPMFPCTSVDVKYKNQCYLMQTSHALRVASDNFSQVFTECSVVDSEFVDTCYQSLGRDASGNSSSNVDQTRTSCMLGQNFDAQSNCVVGAVKDFVSYYHSDKQATILCLSLDTSLQSICQSTKTQYYSTF